MKAEDKYMNAPELQFKERAIRRSGLLLFHKSDVIEIIDFCKELKIEILGFDGFILYPGEKIQPSIEHSIDFSSASNQTLKDDIYTAAMNFINSQDSCYVFEIITA